MIKIIEMYLTPFEDNRRIFIYLPDDYDYSDERYPVTYMFDGQNLFDDNTATFGTSWGLKDFLDNWDKKMIVVGIECASTGEQRAKEYLPFEVNTGIFGLVFGECEKTMQWIIRELKPYIDSHYRTYLHREATAIAGSSFGGVAAAYGVYFHNDVFSKGGLLSPSLTCINKEVMRKIRNGNLNKDTRVYFSYGTAEASKKWCDYMAKLNYNIEQATNKAGYTTYLYRQEGGKHNEADWAKQSDIWLNFLWK
ncbi:MAG: alpha/beta hydrolase-fold protein [Erysipelotrichaceae bacterium]|nr:alpha/beta hydrolase-fold protein [Erysipelotrichaceae bacterium]